MARGPSGRFVIELDPDVKRELHAALASDGITLKEWFRSHVADYLGGHVDSSSGLSSERRSVAETAGRYKSVKR